MDEWITETNTSHYVIKVKRLPRPFISKIILKKITLFSSSFCTGFMELPDNQFNLVVGLIKLTILTM